MGVPISMLRCGWFTEDDIETWLKSDSKPKIFGEKGNMSYTEYARKVTVHLSSMKLDEKHKGKIICYEKVKGDRISRTNYVDRVDEGVLVTNTSKNLFGRAFLRMSPKLYPLGVQKHSEYGKCLVSAPAKIITISVRLDGIPQRLCRQHGHTQHVPDSFFSWLVSNENETVTIDIPIWNPGEPTSSITPDIHSVGDNKSIDGTPRGTPTGRLSRKGRWVSTLSHGSACAKAFHDFINSIPNGYHEIVIEVGFMYNCDELLLLPLEKYNSSVGQSGHVWMKEYFSGTEFVTAGASKERGLKAYPIVLASGTLKLHKSE